MPCNRRIKYFISGIVEHIFVQAVVCLSFVCLSAVCLPFVCLSVVCLPFVCHLKNYEFPVAIKRENMRIPVISKLSGKLSVRQAVCG